MCGCILGWRSVTYHNWVTVTLYLTSELVSRSCIESSAYLLFFEIRILNSMCKCVLGWRHIPFFGNCDLDLWPSFKNYYVRSISLILYEIGIPNLMWMHLGMMECHVPFMGHYDVDLWPRFENNCVLSISPILFKVGIPNLVCGCIFEWWSVTYHFWVSLT